MVDITDKARMRPGGADDRSPLDPFHLTYPTVVPDEVLIAIAWGRMTHCPTRRAERRAVVGLVTAMRPGRATGVETANMVVEGLKKGRKTVDRILDGITVGGMISSWEWDVYVIRLEKAFA